MSQKSRTRNESRITAEQTIIIIRLIRKYRCIWDKSHPDHQKPKVRHEAFRKIASYFDISPRNLIKKYQRFRSVYFQELRLIRDKKKTHSNLFYFDEIDFLRDTVEHRWVGSPKSSSISMAITNTIGSGPSDYQDTNEEILLDEESEQDDNHMVEIQDIEDDSSYSTTEDTEDFTEKSEAIPDQIELEPVEAIKLETIGSTKCTEECLSEDNTNEEKKPEQSPPKRSSADEFGIFAEYLASQLRTMDKISALETMEELQRIIFRRKIENLKKDCSKGTS